GLKSGQSKLCRRHLQSWTGPDHYCRERQRWAGTSGQSPEVMRGRAPAWFLQDAARGDGLCVDLHAWTLRRADRHPLQVVDFCCTPGAVDALVDPRYRMVPVAPAVRAFTTASTNAFMFSTRAVSVKLALPTPAWTMPAFSTRNSTAPPLAPLTAPTTSMVTVPT